jgi:uncharacterized protein YceK
MAHRAPGPSRMALATLCLLAGCATAMEQTPAQKHAYAVYEACRAEGRIPSAFVLERVTSDGRMQWTVQQAGTAGAAEVEACLKEKWPVVKP